jgi:hypothetical protein
MPNPNHRADEDTTYYAAVRLPRLITHSQQLDSIRGLDGLIDGRRLLFILTHVEMIGTMAWCMDERQKPSQ